jgi:metallo-beta-lactamase family protein
MRKPAIPSDIAITFWGAARTVTGSMHLVESDGFRCLLDCGLYQGPRRAARERNEHFPFDPAQINAVILSHAHIDHSGNLPNLVRQGYRGPILCTPATRDLTAVMLADSAKIQEEDAAHLNKKLAPGQPPIRPLYTRQDAFETARHCFGVPYDQPYEVGHGITLRFSDAGHILGSAMVNLEFRTRKGLKSLTFTGDIGRRGLPILRDPAPIPEADLLICESTYGGRIHPPVEELGPAMSEVIRRTVDRGGKLLIPAFSLGRTQAILHYFRSELLAGRVPDIPIYVDSPLAANATEVYRLHPECFDDETARLLEDDPDLFSDRRTRYTRTVEESMAINDVKEPCIIIAASGMCEAGRILHHLKQNIEHARNTILIVGFQAPETLGRRLVERKPRVRIFGREYALRAEVVTMNGFSSHADQNDFDAFLSPLAGRVQKVRLVHGEPDRADALARRLAELRFSEVMAPERGDRAVL